MNIDDSPPWKIGGAKELGYTETDSTVGSSRGKLVVVNKKNHIPTGNDYYCGRGSPLGNIFDFRGSTHPQVKYKVASKAEAISSYETYLRERIKNKDPEICAALNNIYKMTKKGDVYLSCFCWPDDCHVRIIKEIIEEKIC